MAKTRTDLLLPPEHNYLVTASHWGEWGWWEPTAVHAIFAYRDDELPPTVTAWHGHPTLAGAMLEAIDWAHLPELVTDICQCCRLFAPGPKIPRWNIYRGPDKPRVPPCLLWDSNLGPPPWP